jgi:hypothetical protein
LPAPLQRAPDDSARPATGADVGAGCPAAIELAACAAAGAELILDAVRTAGERFTALAEAMTLAHTRERDAQSREVAAYNEILDTLTARNDTLHAAKDRFKAAADGGGSRGRSCRCGGTRDVSRGRAGGRARAWRRRGAARRAGALAASRGNCDGARAARHRRVG